jgi:hypothetical protein
MTIKRYLILLILLFTISKIGIAQVASENKADIDISTTITTQELISVIDNSKLDTSLIVILDFEKWPLEKNKYIAVAYLVSDKERKDNYIATNEIDCDEETESESINIFMFEFKDSLHIIGKYSSSPSAFKYDFNIIKYDGLSLGNYRVADNKVAFGINMRTDASYSGGWMTYYSLALFIKDGDELINIFSDYMGESGELAGEWITGENGEFMGREREDINIERKVTFLTTKTSGYYDMKIQESTEEITLTPSDTSNWNGSDYNSEERISVDKSKYIWDKDERMYKLAE